MNFPFWESGWPLFIIHERHDGYQTDNSSDDHRWVIGAVMNVTGSIFINLGTNLMKLGHLRAVKRKRRVALADAALRASQGLPATIAPTSDDIVVYKCCQDSWTWAPSRNRCQFRRALLSKTWVMGFAAFVIGNAVNFLSFSYAAQSLLASLGSVQFVTNVIFARVVLKETLPWRVLFGTAVLMCGVGLVVKYSCHGNPAVQYSLNELIGLFVHRNYLIYLGSLFCMWVILQCYLMNVHRVDSKLNKNSKLEAISYAAASAIVGAQGVTFFKIVSELMAIVASVTGNDDVTKRAVYESPFSYAVLFAAIFTSLFWVMWVTLSVVGGGIFFHEFEECLQGSTAFMFTLGLLTIFLGVFLLSPQSPDAAQMQQGTTPEDLSAVSPLLEREALANGGAGSHSPISPNGSLARLPASPARSANGSPTPFTSSGNQASRAPGGVTFGLVTMPIVDAVEARDQRANSAAAIASVSSPMAGLVNNDSFSSNDDPEMQLDST